jgi:hypothetical protein
MDLQEMMREYANQRARSAGKSVDELLALVNGNEIEFIQSLEMALQQKSEKAGDDDLSEEEIIVLAIEALEREVNSGGYSQFFVNSSREFTPIIVHALLRIDCPKTAEITKNAIKAVGFEGLAPIALAAALESFSEEFESRNSQNQAIDAIEKKLDECDQQYYRSGEDIGSKLIEFVKANKNTIQP